MESASGGRDLSDAAGGISTLAALTSSMVIPIRKGHRHLQAPGQETLGRITERLRRMRSPSKSASWAMKEYTPASTLLPPWRVVELALGTEHVGEGRTVTPTPGRIVGLFTGGTLCAEAQVVMRAEGIACHSNVPVGADAGLQAVVAFVRSCADESQRASAPHARTRCPGITLRQSLE